MKLRKIPLESLLEILQQLYEDGADYIDISGEVNKDGSIERDVIKITVKPEYLMDDYEEDIEDRVHILSDEDINDLI